MIKALIVDLKKFHREFEKEANQCYRAAKDAVKVEGYRLRKLLQEEIKAGAPGGQRFAPLSEIARQARPARLRNKPALYRLYLPVRYKVVRETSHEMQFGFGFGFQEVSASWRRIARVQQEGGIIGSRVGNEAFRENALRLSVMKAPRTYALKKTTRRFILPPRPIIEPFWDKYQKIAAKNIEANFERKMRGEWV